MTEQIARHILPVGRHSAHVVRVEELFFPEEYPDLIAEEARTLWGAG